MSLAGGRRYCWGGESRQGPFDAAVQAYFSRHLDTLNVAGLGGDDHPPTKAGLKIHEVPSLRALSFPGPATRAIRDGWRILKVIVRERFSKMREPRPAASGLSSIMPCTIAEAGPARREGA